MSHANTIQHLVYFYIDIIVIYENKYNCNQVLDLFLTIILIDVVIKLTKLSNHLSSNCPFCLTHGMSANRDNQ